MTTSPLTLEQAETEAARANLQRLQQVLRENDLGSCVIWFDGAKGEGRFDLVQMFAPGDVPASVDVEGSRTPITRADVRAGDVVLEEGEGSLHELAASVAERLLELHHDTWRKGRGTEGYVTLPVEEEVCVQFDEPEMFENVFHYDPADPFAPAVEPAGEPAL